MSPSPISSQLRKAFEHSMLTTDAARALRSSLAMAAAWIACVAAGHPLAVIVAAPTAQNVGMLDVRGDYRARLAILLALTFVLSSSAMIGAIAGNHVLSATLTIGLLALLAGCFRYLSGDYGPHFSLTSGLLYFLGLTMPGDWSHAGSLFVATCFGGVVGILVQLSGWFVRPQHALRNAVAEAWVASSDLITAMRPETDDGELRVSAVAEKENALRSTIDRSLQAIHATSNRPDGPLASHFDDATQLAARVASRATALYTAVEGLQSHAGFAAISSTLDSALRALASAMRSAALTVITHRAEQLISLKVRLQRASDLLQVLDTRLTALKPADAEVTQVRQMLTILAALLPVVGTTLEETVDHGAPHAGFGLRLPELSGMSMRALGAWLNPPAQVDWILVRYTLRAAVVLMLAVAAYKGFDIPRGHWIGFTSLVVLQPDYGATRKKLGQRLLGTVAGITLGSFALWLRMPSWCFIACASVMAFCFAYFVRRRYALAVFFVTLMIVLMTEASMPVHMDLPIARLLSTLAGGALALVAALLFWPKWERDQSPDILAAALRANRGYLDAIAGHLSRGERFTGQAVLTKREAERANSLASASLQRLLSEPVKVQKDVERIATLTTYNQRLTRAITVLGQHLNQCNGRKLARIEEATAKLTESLDAVAERVKSEAPSPSPSLPPIASSASFSTGDALIHRQLTKIATEIDALALAAEGKAISA